MKKLLLLLTLLLWLPIAQANEAEYQRANEAYGSGDYKTAFTIFKPLAEQGYVDAQNNLGYLYSQGQGVPQNYGEALKWYRKASIQGDAEAQYNLGNMYRQGLGASQNDGEALKWFRKASKQGHATAQNNLGLMYALGYGVPQNFIYSYMWVSLAKTNGYEEAQKTTETLTKSMSSEELAEAQDLSTKCWDSNYQDCPE